MLIYLSIYSNTDTTLKRFLIFVNKIIKNKKIKTKIFLMHRKTIQKLKTFTVLKSPHVNKKAQEHFKLCKYKSVIELNTFQSQNFFLILKKVQKRAFPDIYLKVSIRLLDQKKKKSHTNPNLFKMKCYKRLLFSNPLNYIKIFDVFGELSIKKSFSNFKSLDSSVGRAKD